MKELLDIPAPAKLNLFLHITGKRTDGYHLLQSAFMLIDWCDTLHLQIRSDGLISREDLRVDDFSAQLPLDDLCVRAAQALQKASGTRLGVHIGLEKRIPAQAGMGGGSSDAASCLLGLNRLWGLGWSREALQAIGLQLGADVPFFLLGQNAWVEGIGEYLTAVSLPEQTFIVIKPPEGLATAEIFSHPLLKRDTPHARIYDFVADPFEFGHNDLQPVAEVLSASVTNAIDWLQKRGLRGRMTGSGSAVFSLLKAETASRINLSDLPPNWQSKLCNNMKVHPLFGWANSARF
jgi:4-diphosphocytidyl-2-C-methyl-D-erythritol kinase